MALTNMALKTKNWSHLGEEETVEKKERRRRRGRGREEEEEKKRSSKKVWKLTLIMDSMRLCMNFHAWLVSRLSPNLGFC